MSHYYDNEGQPAYTQIVATGKNKGKERPTTLRDAKKLGLSPSVTTVLSILDKPALTSWKVKHALANFGWEISKWLPAIIAKRFVTQFKITEPDNEDKAKRGSEIHAAIEQWLEGGTCEDEYMPYINILRSVFEQLNIKITDEMYPEISFTSKLGYGGAIDLPVWLGEDRPPIIIDFKTKDMDEKKASKPLVYDEHVAQLGAYRMGVGWLDAECYNLFLSRDNPHVYQLHKWKEAEVKRGENLFLRCLDLWCVIKKYKIGGNLK